MTQITAIHDGGDWYDASADYLILPAGIDFATEKQKWQKWYKTEFCPAWQRGEGPVYLNIVDWLKALGAREPTDEELTIEVCR